MGTKFSFAKTINFFSFASSFFFIFYSITLYAKDTKNGKATHRSTYTYVDVAIHQPDVNDCYGTSSDQLLREEVEWIKIFPNPNRGVFTLEMKLEGEPSILNVIMLDISGRQVFELRYLVDSQSLAREINVSFLETGVYILRVEALKNSRIAVKRLLIH